MTKTCMMIAVLALAGCSKKSAGSGDCASAVDKGVQTMTSGGLDRVPDDQKAAMQAGMKETGDKLKDILTKHCVDDKWSAEVLDCYAKATSQPDIRGCRNKLPADQAEKIGTEIREVMMSSGMRGMRGMHGGPGGGHGGAMGAPPSGGEMGAPGGETGGSAAAPSGGSGNASGAAGTPGGSSGSAAAAPAAPPAGSAPATQAK
jgi:hypothetical protein